MMTQSHVAIGLLFAARSGKRAAIAGAIFGGVTPDFGMVPMMLVSYFLLGQDMGQIWETTYYSVPWWTIDQLTNSAPLYTILLTAALLAGRRVTHWWPGFVSAFALTGLLHVAFDFLTHASDGHIHFWPLSDFIFASPVSYWESDHFGQVFGLLEALGGLGAAVVLWRVYRGWQVRTFAGLLALLSVAGLTILTLFAVGFWDQPANSNP